ncbi:hypothetical protein X975_03707, partial [Stegodyphus mimosarum]
MRNLRDLAEREAKLVQCAVRDMEDNLIDPDYILKLSKSTCCNCQTANDRKYKKGNSEYKC